jgi:hypothetical protein
MLHQYLDFLLVPNFNRTYQFNNLYYEKLQDDDLILGVEKHLLVSSCQSKSARPLAAVHVLMKCQINN